MTPSALAFQHRKRPALEIEDDVAHVRARAFGGEPVVALHGRLDRLGWRVEIDRRLGGGGGRARDALGAGVRLGQQRGDAGVGRLDGGGGRAAHGALRRQFAPTDIARRASRASRRCASCRSSRSGKPGCSSCRSCRRPPSTTTLTPSCSMAPIGHAASQLWQRMQISGSIRCCLTGCVHGASRHVQLDIFEIAGLVVDADLRRRRSSRRICRARSRASSAIG